MYAGKYLPQACVHRGRVEAGGIARCHDEDDPMAECLVLEAERDGILDQAGLVRHFLDLLRADPIPRRLDHVVTPSDEVQEALLVADHDIAGPDRQLGRASSTGQFGGSRNRSAVRSASFQ